MGMRWSLFLLAAALLPAQTPTIEQSINLRSVAAPRLSPDGQWVAYQVQSANWEDNLFEIQIWVASTITGERHALTYSKKSSTSPEWSPDGRRIAFLSDRDGKQQLYVITAAGGEAAQLTGVDSGVTGFHWSPDGHTIAYTSAGPEDPARKDRKDRYGDFEDVQHDYVMIHLWLIPVPEDVREKPKAEPLTKGSDFSVGQFSWSPDGKQIAFGAAHDPDLGSSGSSDIYLLRVADKGIMRIVSSEGPDRNPIWSPDGKQIAFESANGKPYYYYSNSVIAVVSADGGQPRALTESFDEDPHLLAWAPEGIYFEAMQKTTEHLYRLDAMMGTYVRISAPDTLAMSQTSFSADFSKAAFVCAAPNHFSEICATPVRQFAAKSLTNMGDQITGFKLASREVMEWKTKDGVIVEGILIKPADFDPARKYPLLVVIHGGPTGVDRPVVQPDRYYPIERFAAKGAVILRPNYRGSSGYGERFRALNVRNLGLGDYEDVIAGVDALIARGYIDKDRVGAMGWSQGGYISAFMTTYSDRFKAISVGAGITDWMTYYVNTDIHPFTRQYLKATPWDDPEIYRKTSPITYVSKAKTPTLIQHGENDRRVPIPNAYELYQALQDKGVPVRMIVYKGFGHGIDKPKQQRAVMEHNYSWFSHWVWGEKQLEISLTP